MSPKPEQMVETSLVVRDLDRARSFYERVFGLQTVIAYEGVVGMQLPDGMVLLLFYGESSHPHQHAAPAPHIRFGVPHGTLAEWDRHLMMQGIVVESRVIGRDGGSSLFFRDPDHNSLEVVAEVVAKVA